MALLIQFSLNCGLKVVGQSVLLPKNLYAFVKLGSSLLDRSAYYANKVGSGCMKALNLSGGLRPSVC